MDFQETVSRAQDAVTVRRVYGEAVERDGVTVIPAADVRGGGGGGGGEDAEGGVGSGLGFGIAARPVGAFVIENGRVRWQPTIDLSRMAFHATLALASAFLLARRRRE